jgi:siroheme synthase
MHFKFAALVTAAFAGTALAQSGNSIADLISSNSDLSTLAALLTNGTFGNFSSVTTTLSNSTNGNWTVFAPSNR